MIGLGVVTCLVLAVAVAVALKVTRRPRPVPAVPAASIVAEAPPPPLASDVPSASEAPSASESAVADNPPVPDEPTIPPQDHRHGMLVIDCTPSCDSVFVDGHPVTHAEEGTLLDPGVHMLAVRLLNHAPRVQSVWVRQGRVRRLKIAF
jgi:hypothetical protein